MNEMLLCRVDPAALLRVRGPDAAAFLQGQFTNELRRTGLRPSTYGLWLNQKGRVLADSFVLGRDAEAFEVVSLGSGAATIRERLEAYIIADDVTVEDGTAGVVGWAIVGKAGERILEQCGLALPEGAEFAEHDGASVFRARLSAGPNWFLCAPADACDRWEDRVTAWVKSGDGRWAEREELEFQRIDAGVPAIPQDLGPGDLPMEGGLEHEALSFTKGCYLGQEVMARLHNMGQVRRRLHVVRFSGGEALAPGAPLFSGERQVGELRSVARRVDAGVGLAMLHLAHAKPGDELACRTGASAELAVQVTRIAEGRAW